MTFGDALGYRHITWTFVLISMIRYPYSLILKRAGGLHLPESYITTTLKHLIHVYRQRLIIYQVNPEKIDGCPITIYGHLPLSFLRLPDV